MSKLDAVRAALEILYYLSGPVLAGAAIYGLQQLGIMKKNARVSAQRDAVKASLDQVHYYNAVIVPEIDQLRAAIDEKRVTFFSASTVKVETNSVYVNYPRDPQIGVTLSLVLAEFIPVVNSLEAFSLSFLSRLADEEIAFRALGKEFCETVRDLIPGVLLLKSGSSSGHVSGRETCVLGLFRIWWDRLERERLALEAEQIQRELEAKRGTQVIRFPPIGTEDSEY